MSFHANLSWSAACLLAIALQTLVPHKLCSANPDSTYRFETKQGEIVGAWPDVWTVERLVQLRTRYGFNFIAVPAERAYYNAALEAGYTPQHILLTFSYGYGPTAVDSFPSMIVWRNHAAVFAAIERRAEGRYQKIDFLRPKAQANPRQKLLSELNWVLLCALTQPYHNE